ncbi:NAD-dependent epimerase/dehydratase family protein [Actinobacteria bacterium YIM 96077]|uniref:NADH-flavin reductase n=1 Tax=Phytoactinopolyspora halophila TaxID=1981511 RepID=A0A329QTE9_9ACTN|nr:NAD(P)H-binding protein [Phytoactinopolyspora halophila]AYY13763.1 NAD-dependent epimerase/dehydratase family protein [Actinobacteria bacterium YIM 96077]RAW15694.1 NADH-flavin reductase [Phytoactinopolyspora halophila]
MKITVIGATGMVGTRVTDEAVRRGHQVTAICRNPGTDGLPSGVTTVAADANDAVTLRSLLADTDVAVLSVRPAPGFEATLAAVTTAVLDAAAATGTRVLVAGGAGPLRSPNRPDLLVADDPAYVPAEYSAIAAASTDQLRACQSHPDATWTYLSPPALLAPGERTGIYRRGTETLLIDDDGISRISAEDFAIAVLDELGNPAGAPHLTVAY